MSGDTRRVLLTAMHQQVTDQLLGLMHGFYTNIEDSLFEMAYRNEDGGLKRRYFELMRELRIRRANLLKLFARGMHGMREGWFEPIPATGARAPAGTALEMANRCRTHFTILLNDLEERAFDDTAETRLLPIDPGCIAQQFLRSCRALRFDDEAIQIVQELFCRFVLDRMGTIYGDCNRQLGEAGFSTRFERGDESQASA